MRDDNGVCGEKERAGKRARHRGRSKEMRDRTSDGGSRGETRQSGGEEEDEEEEEEELMSTL